MEIKSSIKLVANYYGSSPWIPEGKFIEGYTDKSGNIYRVYKDIFTHISEKQSVIYHVYKGSMEEPPPRLFIYKFKIKDCHMAIREHISGVQLIKTYLWK